MEGTSRVEGGLSLLIDREIVFANEALLNWRKLEEPNGCLAGVARYSCLPALQDAREDDERSERIEMLEVSARLSRSRRHPDHAGG